MSLRTSAGLAILLAGAVWVWALHDRARAADTSSDAAATSLDLEDAGADYAHSLDDCPLCAADPGVPIVRLTRAEADAAARACAERNAAEIARIDSLERAGRFGAPHTSKARRNAQVLMRLATHNAYHELFRLALDPHAVYEAGESTLAGVFRDYTDPGLYSIARLQRVRMGLGRVCVRYDLSRQQDFETSLGSKRLRVRVEDVVVDGAPRRMMRLDLPTGVADVVEVLLSEHYTFEVEHQRIAGPPGPYELFLVHDIHGGWLRKWGTHRPTAFLFYATPWNAAHAELPSAPLAGVRIYVPHIRLRLPSLLPDLGLEDLRSVNLPQPILSRGWLATQHHLDWSDVEPYGFADWAGCGALPPAIRRRFPNL